MKKIMFVCHGNICRSPMAEMIFSQLVRENHKEDQWFAASAAVSQEEWGNPMYPPAVRAMNQAGYSVDKTKRARVFTMEDYREFDHIYVMDHSNLRRMQRITDGDPQGKVELLLEATGLGSEVADPYYCGGFDRVLMQIEAACRTLAKNFGIM